MSRPTTHVDSSGVTHRVLTLYDDNETLYDNDESMGLVALMASDACQPGWKMLRVGELRSDRDVDCMGCLVRAR